MFHGPHGLEALPFRVLLRSLRLLRDAAGSPSVTVTSTLAFLYVAVRHPQPLGLPDLEAQFGWSRLVCSQQMIRLGATGYGVLAADPVEGRARFVHRLSATGQAMAAALGVELFLRHCPPTRFGFLASPLALLTALHRELGQPNLSSQAAMVLLYVALQHPRPVRTPELRYELGLSKATVCRQLAGLGDATLRFEVPPQRAVRPLGLLTRSTLEQRRHCVLGTYGEQFIRALATTGRVKRRPFPRREASSAAWPFPATPVPLGIRRQW